MDVFNSSRTGLPKDNLYQYLENTSTGTVLQLADDTNL